MKIQLIAFLTSLISLFITPSKGLTQISASDYISKYKDDAIKEMEKYKIPASITLAQGMLESSNGNSDLAVNANNHFGIKCHSDWSGKTMHKDDDKKNECFRKYSSVLESYEDHSKFLATRTRYASLFELETTDYKGWAHGLKKAGYATDPNYPKRLIDIIEKYELYKYDSYKKDKKIKEDKKKKSNIKSEKQASTPQQISNREILRIGIIKYIIVKKSDTFEKIARDTDKDLWQLYKYNDLSKSDTLTIGEKLFLQPKRNKAKTATHILKNGETMRTISQFYGIKLNSLYKKNNLEEGEKPSIGTIIYMQKNKPSDSTDY